MKIILVLNILFFWISRCCSSQENIHGHQFFSLKSLTKTQQQLKETIHENDTTETMDNVITSDD